MPSTDFGPKMPPETWYPEVVICTKHRRASINHILVNFNWSGKQSLSTGVGLKNRGVMGGGRTSLRQVSISTQEARCSMSNGTCGVIASKCARNKSKKKGRSCRTLRGHRDVRGGPAGRGKVTVRRQHLLGRRKVLGDNLLLPGRATAVEERREPAATAVRCGRHLARKRERASECVS